MEQYSGQERLRGAARQELLEQLHSSYAVPGYRQRLWMLRKKYAWLFVVQGSYLLKRVLDVVVSFFALVFLSPVMLIVAVSIKLYDGGSILYVTERVGQWGECFSFPKFRSMMINADKIKEKILDQNDHEESITFKMKKDPRVTPIGRWIRKLSIDELPQLWCVLIGEMSLVGPRPPTICEVEKYTLEDRRRLDTKPGITCFWQVQGRGDIPFDQQLLLDRQYIESQGFWTDMTILLKTIPAVLLGKGAY